MVLSVSVVALCNWEGMGYNVPIFTQFHRALNTQMRSANGKGISSMAKGIPK